MTVLDALLRNNRDWAERVSREDPGFFERLSQQQAPKYLWIGCSIRGCRPIRSWTRPGRVFVTQHRQCRGHTDLNACR